LLQQACGVSLLAGEAGQFCSAVKLAGPLYTRPARNQRVFQTI
jgi:hypothetical protein